MANLELKKGQRVRFIKKALVYNDKDMTQFNVEPGTEAVVIEDKDMGPIGSVILSLKKADNTIVNVKTNDDNLEVI